MARRDALCRNRETQSQTNYNRIAEEVACLSENSLKLYLYFARRGGEPSCTAFVLSVCTHARLCGAVAVLDCGFQFSMDTDFELAIIDEMDRVLEFWISLDLGC